MIHAIVVGLLLYFAASMVGSVIMYIFSNVNEKGDDDE